MGRNSKHTVRSEDYGRAKRLRQQQTPAEKRLWDLLRQVTKAENIRFRRQHPLAPYIVDFACLAAKLVIELDGDSHDARQSYDDQRTAYIERAGYTVLRFTNEEVTKNAEGVAVTILARIYESMKD